MTCIFCELTRAKAIARLMKLGGKTAEEIAEALTKNLDGTYVVSYYPTISEVKAVHRENSVPPHVPYVIVTIGD